MRLFQALVIVSLASVTVANAKVVNAANCSSAAVQAAIDSPTTVGGDIVVIPNGSCTWTSGVTIDKGLILRGLIPGGVTIINRVTSSPAINITEDSTFHTQVSHLAIVGDPMVNQEYPAIDVAANGASRAVLIHDMVFTTVRAIRMNTNHGVIYSNIMNDNLGIRDFVQCTPAGYALDSWTTMSTMGMADTTGQSNIYVEDNVITYSKAQSIDIAGGCRIVIRNNVFDHSALSSHGADTEPTGLRHFELYDNKFIWVDSGAQTVCLDYFFFLRGGTGVITNNTGLIDMHNQECGDKLGLRMTVMNLRRNGGPNPCWGAGTSATEYPAPRQIGMGRVTGTGTDGQGRTVDNGSDGNPGTYVGDIEPLYIWNQPGLTPTIQDYGPNDEAMCTGSEPYDTSANYIVLNRDYRMTAKPYWERYTYPHPLRLPAPGAPPNLRIVP